MWSPTSRPDIIHNKIQRAALKRLFDIQVVQKAMEYRETGRLVAVRTGSYAEYWTRLRPIDFHDSRDSIACGFLEFAKNFFQRQYFLSMHDLTPFD